VLGPAVETPIWTARFFRLLEPEAAILLLASPEEVDRQRHCLREVSLQEVQAVPTDWSPAELAECVAQADPAPPPPDPARVAALLLGALPGPTIGLDENLRVCIAGPGVRPLLGRPARSLEGRPLTECFTAADRDWQLTDPGQVDHDLDTMRALVPVLCPSEVTATDGFVETYVSMD